MRLKRFVTSAAVLVLAGGVFAGCGGDSDSNDNAANSDKTGITTTTEAEASGTTLSLVAKDFKFDQSALSATAGKTVTFRIKNEDDTEHNLTIKDLNVDKDVEEGESAEETVSDLKAGTYDYFCEYHPAQMKGTLTVS